ncbi:MAG: hypothetical protein J6K21_05395 [Bacilli bacterium]|nr:hypothetical protein [Bacilli bacterium]
MIKHTHTDSSEINFSKLEKRILNINDPLLNKSNDIREMLYQLTIDNMPTLIVATGGSKVVAYYLQLIIERLGIDGIICEVIEPRDYFYKANRNQFSNLIAISSSGNTNGIKEAFNDFNGSKFLITQNNQEADYQVVSWSNEKYDTEKSFISLVSTLGPITLMLDSTASLNMEIGYDEIKKINDKIKELFIISKEKIDKLSVNFKDTSLIQVISGYETKTSSSILESNLVEIGLAAPVIHDKGSFCHGRSNLLFQYPNSHVIYLCHQRRELDDILIELINREYSNISIFDIEDIKENYFLKEYYLILQMYFLSKKIADDKNIDLTQPEYNPKLVKKLYNFRGEM